MTIVVIYLTSNIWYSEARVIQERDRSTETVETLANKLKSRISFISIYDLFDRSNNQDY